MSDVTLNIDENLLAEAVEEMGARTRDEAVNELLRERVMYARRMRALDEIHQMAEEGALDLEFMMEKKNYRP